MSRGFYRAVMFTGKVDFAMSVVFDISDFFINKILCPGHAYSRYVFHLECWPGHRCLKSNIKAPFSTNKMCQFIVSIIVAM